MTKIKTAKNRITEREWQHSRSVMKRYVFITATLGFNLTYGLYYTDSLV